MTVFAPVKIGGGGFSTDLDYSPDGTTRLCRTDVHGCYIWNSVTSQWDQLITSATMPSGDRQLGNNDASVYEVRCAPSSPSRIYIAYPGFTNFNSTVYRSDDRGASFSKLTGFTAVSMSVAADRLSGPKMAVDPQNPDHVIIGDSAGLFYRTTDGGTTWAQITGIPTTSISAPVVCFDPSSALTGSLTSTVYLAWGTGTNRVYRSTNGGASFSQLTGGPNTIKRLVCPANGILHVCDAGSTATNYWHLSGTTWTNVTAIVAPGTSNNWHSVAVDPTNNNNVSLGAELGNVATSTDGGTTWGGYYGNAPARSSPVVPWLAATNEDAMSNGNMVYDPVVAGRLWFAEGIGVWYIDNPPTGTAQPTWTSSTVGIETLIADHVIFPPGGKPLVAVQDRGVFKIDDPAAYPSVQGPYTDVPIRHGWALDYATSDPTFIVGVFDGGATARCSKSTDGGATWADFGADPTGGAVGGGVAAASATNFVIFPGGNGQPKYTTDGGTTWTSCGSLGTTGWNNSSVDLRKPVCADRVNSGTYYAYNYNTGLYKSTDGGATWASTGQVAVTGGTASVRGGMLVAVQGHAGHLFYACGTGSPSSPHPDSGGLYRSTDGATLTKDANVQECWCVAVGATAPSGSYPAIYIVGYANGSTVAGIYRSTDNCATWALLSANPYNSTDQIFTIAADQNTYGVIYFGNSGSGVGYGVETAFHHGGKGLRNF